MALTQHEADQLRDIHEGMGELRTGFQALKEQGEVTRLAIFGNGGAPGLKANMRLVLWVIGLGGPLLVAIATAIATAAATAIAARVSGG